MTGVDQAAFRRAAGRFASGIVVVSTSLDGVSHAMTATAFTAVSVDPLLVLVCAAAGVVASFRWRRPGDRRWPGAGP